MVKRYRDEIEATRVGERWMQMVAVDTAKHLYPFCEIQQERCETLAIVMSMFCMNELIAQYVVVRDSSNFSVLTANRYAPSC
jgi:hypothetical protein